MPWRWALQSRIFMISTSIGRRSASAKTKFGLLTTMATGCPAVTLSFIAWNHWNPSEFVSVGWILRAEALKWRQSTGFAPDLWKPVGISRWGGLWITTLWFLSHTGSSGQKWGEEPFEYTRERGRFGLFTGTGRQTGTSSPQMKWFRNTMWWKWLWKIMSGIIVMEGWRSFRWWRFRGLRRCFIATWTPTPWGWFLERSCFDSLIRCRLSCLLAEKLKMLPRVAGSWTRRLRHWSFLRWLQFQRRKRA